MEFFHQKQVPLNLRIPLSQQHEGFKEIEGQPLHLLLGISGQKDIVAEFQVNKEAFRHGP